MKTRIRAVFWLVVLFTISANAAPQKAPIVSNMVYGGVESRHNVRYQPEFQGSFYVAAKAALNLASFKNNYYFESDPGIQENDKYSFVKQLGFALSAGYQFAPKWRAELDYAYSGKFEDQDSYATFALSSQSLMVNAVYNLSEWNSTNIYAGAGAGALMLEVKMSGPVFMTDGKDSQNKMVPAGQIILGVEEFLTDKFAIGAEYKLIYNSGATVMRKDVYGDVLVTEVGGVLTNSFRAGIRYKF